MIKQRIKNSIKKTGLYGKLLDYRKNRLLDNPEITDLILYANSFCNARCKMCDVGVNKRDGIRRPLLDTPKYLELSTLEKILNDETVAGRKLCIIFLMTEPLLAPELPEMLKMCKAGGHWVKVTTNGFLLKKRAAEIAGYIDSLQLSLDGLEELHDSVRGKNFFSSAIEGIKELRSLNDKVMISINYTVSSLNYFQLFDFLKHMDGLGIPIDLLKFQFLDFVNKKMADEHNMLHPGIPQTTSSLNDELSFDKIDFNMFKDQISRVKDYVPENINKVAFKPSLNYNFTLEEYFSNEGGIIKGLDKCYTPWTQVAINTAGDVFWHMRCFNDYVLGNVNEKDLKEIFYGEKASRFRDELRESGLCFPACSRCCGLMPMDHLSP